MYTIKRKPNRVSLLLWTSSEGKKNYHIESIHFYSYWQLFTLTVKDLFSILILLLSYPSIFLFIIHSTHNLVKKSHESYGYRKEVKRVSPPSFRQEKKSYRIDASLFVLTIVYTERERSFLSLVVYLSIFAFYTYQKI